MKQVFEIRMASLEGARSPVTLYKYMRKLHDSVYPEAVLILGVTGRYKGIDQSFGIFLSQDTPLNFCFEEMASSLEVSYQAPRLSAHLCPSVIPPWGSEGGVCYCYCLCFLMHTLLKGQRGCGEGKM